MMEKVFCAECGKECVRDSSSIGAGYACFSAPGETEIKRYCYVCAAWYEMEQMNADGKAILYFDEKARLISNWTGVNFWKPVRVSQGRHNITGKRIDVWFYHDHAIWHGVNYSPDWQQIVRCARTKASPTSYHIYPAS